MAVAETTKTETKTTDTDLARKIWLAGVGAYGRVFAEAQGQFEKLADSASDVFEELVERGVKVEDTVRAQIAANEPTSKVLATVEKVTKQAADFRAERRAALKARIESVRETVTETLAPLNLMSLHKTVEELAAEVETLKAEVAALKGGKAAPVKAVAARAPSAPRVVKAAKKED